VVAPPVKRQVSMVTVAGRRWSSPLAAFVKAIRAYGWPLPARADLEGYDRADHVPV
jgi:hypothetical protein